MATTLGSLQVNINAKTASFDRGMAKSRKGLKNFDKGAKQASFSLKKFAGILAGSALAVGFTRMIKSQLESIDKLAKTSDKLGVQTEQLVGLSHAANIGGVSVESLYKSVEKMGINLADAARGTGEAQKALKVLNLDASDLIAMKPEDALHRIADAMLGVENKTLKLRVAYDLFGRSGTDMINVLAGGAAGLNKMQKEAEDLGLTLTRLEAAQVEAANDALTRLDAAIKGAAQSITVNLSPNLKILADDLVGVAKDINNTESQLGGLTSFMDSDFVGAVQDAFAIFNRLVKEGAASTIRHAANIAEALAFLGVVDKQTAESLRTSATSATAEADAGFDLKANPLPSTRVDEQRRQAIGDASRAASNPGRNGNNQQLTNLNRQQLDQQRRMEAHLRFLASQQQAVPQPVRL